MNSSGSADARNTTWVSIGLILGGATVVSGSVLPWLTLFAGLQRYSGMIGVYGWLICAAGTVAVGIGLVASRVQPTWLMRTSMLFGAALLAFTFWLLAGLQQIVNHPSAVMLAPSPGPGLFVIFAGAAILVVTPVLQGTVHLRH